MNRTARLASACSLCVVVTASHAAPEEVVVTAAKHGAETLQDLPMALNTFGPAELRARNVEALPDLSYVMPNVQIEDLGTARGIANIAIRGVGVNSSIPSVDPAVGIFVDGQYLGMNAGTLTNLLDVEAVDVLRGPQGTLYGHNVTGGAVVLRTRAPTDSFEASGRLAVESGPAVLGEAAVSGPLVPGKLLARLAVQGSYDSGKLTNGYDHSQFGENSSQTVRLSLQSTPETAFEAILRLEEGRQDGDGPAGQNHALFARGSFDFAIDNPGYASTRWQQATFEANWHIPFGDGTITSISGWRGVGVRWAADIDSTPVFVFHTRILNSQSQRSEELRYAGTFGPVEAVAGFYYLDQKLLYIDERNFSPSFRRTGGGRGHFADWALFGSTDWHATDVLTFSAGLRFTHEAKDSQISRVRRAADNLDGAIVVAGEGVAGGDLDAHTLNTSDHPFAQSWDDFSPRLSAQWQPSPNSNLYASWSEGFRGGGANFRVSSLGLAPRSYDPEKQSTLEIGWKQIFDRGRLNLALFHNRISAMQRETNLADPISGVQQVVLNAGNATIFGGEIEARWDVTEHFAIAAEAGYVRGTYTSVTQDLNGDLAVTAADRLMRIPRLAPLSGGVDLYYTAPLAGGTMAARFGLHHRDANFYNDTNLGRLAETDMIDTNIAFTPSSGLWSLSLYGKNLTDVATWGGDTTLPSTAAFGYSGGAVPTFSPLNPGRIIGVELRARY